MPQGWKMELAAIEGAAAKWDKAVEIAILAEQLGFDSIWGLAICVVLIPASSYAVMKLWTFARPTAE